MTEHPPVICPVCNLQRPTYEEVLAYKDEPEGSEVYTRVEAYNTCCNPLCCGTWGTNCWHCHHPRFLDETCDDRIFECAYRFREEKGAYRVYWLRLIQMSSERIIEAAEEAAFYGERDIKKGRTNFRGVFRDEAIAARDALLVAEPLKLKAKTILECKLAVCKYCRASAETGETTMHTCVAAPLSEMFAEVIGSLAIPDELMKGSSPAGLRDEK